MTSELEKAQALRVTNKIGAVEILNSIVKRDVDTNSEEEIKVKEQAILDMGAILAELKQAEDLAALIKFTRPFLSLVSKAKAAKLVRALVDLFLDMEASTGKEVDLCKECIEWAKDEKRTFLRQALEARLIALYHETEKYQEALQLGSSLLKELKKLDDKALAALTSGRTTANGIYCPPKLQAALDMQSGILHAADEKDFKTAYSYFYEAFEGYDSIEHPKAVVALKYMLLAKIMLNTADEVQAIVSGKLALKYSGAEVEAMKSIAQASHKRSLADFQKVQHVANLIKLPMATVEKKLSQMILDKKFHGILDQGAGVLIIFDETPVDKTYESSLDTIQNMGKVVDALYNKAKKLT
ncbi:hypothetical protein KUTeg_008389 [Tegillarca granosa]|uniref:PCI domain-containing protein n=1 Tax=Tegillarca granosa TaxID=220873 RepID=A0ABQ9FDT4_TEGGR|nr:hypothetical protein KUTeg_008389 [Tegillarca granosa]